MREIVLDTETTGLNPFDGHRIVEIGAVELWHQVPTGRTYHQYINPERDMPEDAFNVHGISSEFLADKPVFTGHRAGLHRFHRGFQAGDPQRVFRHAVPERGA
jgi:DNA polymerase-3 subunit epsilon